MFHNPSDSTGENLAVWFKGRRRTGTMDDVKVRLSSRCVDTQMGAVTFLDTALQQDESSVRDVILDEDLVGFLCNAMSTNSLPLIEKTASVIERLSDSDKMLLDGHVVLAVETAQRCAHILWRQLSACPQSESTLCIVLVLITTLLHRWLEVFSGSNRSVSSVCQPVGLLTVLKNVLGSKTDTRPDSQVAASKCLCVTLQVLEVEKLDSGLDTLVAACACHSLKVLKKIVQDSRLEEDEDDEEEDPEALTYRLNAMDIICTLCSCITRVRCTNEVIQSEEVEFSEHFDSPLVAAEKESCSCVLTLCVPLMLSSENIFPEFIELAVEGPPASGRLDALLEALQVSLDMGISRGGLADSLAEKFLFALPIFQRNSWHVGSIIPLRLLCTILAHLASDQLRLADWWESGIEDLARHLTSAAFKLPADNNQWPSVLSAVPFLPWNKSAGPEGAAQQMVMLLVYFKALVGSGKREKELAILAGHLAEYVMSLPSGRRLPAVVLKTVWFSLAECQLGSSGDSSLGADLRRASGRLMELLQEPGQLEAAYSHNPLLLYWMFEVPGVPSQVQQIVSEQWLSRGESPLIFADIIRVKRQAVFPLLDVVAAGAPVVAAGAAQVLLESRNQWLGEALWQVLPGALARCSQDRTDGARMAEACGQLLWLLSELYEQPVAEVALRTAHLLAAVLCRRRLNDQPRSLTSAMLVATMMVRDSCSSGDQRVLGTLLVDPRFPQAVVDAVAIPDPQVCSAAMKLLLELESNNARIKASACSNTTPISGKLLVSCLKSKNLEVLESTLELVAMLFIPTVDPTSVSKHHVVAADLDTTSMKMMYWTLQNLAVKTPPKLQTYVWSALKCLLIKYKAQAQQPWNHYLIEFTLRSPPPELKHAFLLFVLEWLRGNAPAKPPQPEPRRVMPSLLTKTAIHIATAILRADEQFQDETIVKNICQELFTVTADFPKEIQEGIKKIAIKKNVN